MEVEKLKKEYDLQVDWRPFLLRPETPPEGLPVPAYVHARRKDPNDPLKRRAAAAGLVMVDRDIIPSTWRAHQAGEYAREAGRLDPFHAAILRRYWSEGQDLWDWGVLREAAREAGLDPDEMQAAVEAGRFQSVLEDALRDARDLGIEAIPTFLVGGRLVIQGAQEYPVFKRAMERLGVQPRSAG